MFEYSMEILTPQKKTNSSFPGTIKHSYFGFFLSAGAGGIQQIL